MSKSFRNPVWLRVIFGFALAMMTGGLSAGQVGVVPEYRVTQWKVEDGLPQSSVQQIAQTSDGYLWLGTLFGLARFDGVKFTVFDLGNTPAMHAGADSVEALAADRDGALWIGISGGLLLWRNREFTLYTNGLWDLEVRALCVARDGTLWVGQRRGVSHMRDGVLTPVTTTDLFDNVITRRIVETRDGAVWIGTDTGLVRRDPATGEFAEYPLPDATGLTVLSLHEDHQGRLWASVQERGELFCIETNHIRRVKLPPGENVKERHLGAASVLEDRWGEIWVSLRMGGGLHRLNAQDQIEPFHDERGLLVPEATCALEDREGNLWLGTRTEGLLRMQRRRVQTLLSGKSARLDIAWSISAGVDDTVWTGTDGGVWRLRGDQLDIHPLARRADSVLATSAGTVWCAIRGEGVLKWDPEEFAPQPQEFPGQDLSRVNALHEGRAGTLWFGAEQGLARYGAGGDLQWFGTEQGLNNGDVRAILEDSRGAVWVATFGGGLFQMTNGQFFPFNTAHGLSHNDSWALHEDSSGAIWAGTQHGLNRIKDGRCFAFTTVHGLFNNVINHLIEDDAGNFWISCNRGIFRVARAELEAVAEGRETRVHSFVISEGDGMLTGETNGERQPAGCRTRDGRLWFPTQRGVVVVDPRKLTAYVEPPTVVIEKVSIGDDRILGDGHPAAQPVKLGPGRAGILQIAYTASSFVAPSKVCFKYRLVPLESKWVEDDSRRIAFYHNLSPGRYRFEVLACNHVGVWTPLPAVFEFILTPAFWQTRWFKALCILCGVTLLGFAQWYHLQNQRRQARARQEAAIESERQRIAQNMHDELGSSLASISILSDLAGKDAALPEASHPHLARIATGTRELIARLSELVWSTSPRNDPVEQVVDHFLAHAKDFLEPAGVRCRFDVPGQLPRQPLPSQTRHHLFLAFKEALNNVWRHARATEVWIRVRFDEKELTVIIEDNGCGFDPAVPVSGHGRENLRQRMKEARGRYECDSAPGRGTIVRLVVPIR